MGIPYDRPVLFFDGVCNLCSRAVQFMLRHDRRRRFLFAPLQPAAGSLLPAGMADAADTPVSVVLAYRGRYYRESDAVLHALRLLGGGWRLLFAGIIIPRFVRDRIYRRIARNRYRWFGKRDACMVPDAAQRARFLQV